MLEPQGESSETDTDSILTPVPAERQSRWRRFSQFRLSTLLLAVALFAVLMAWLTRARATHEATALLRVRHGPGLIYDLNPGFLSLEAQQRLIRSPIVMNEALAVPGVSNLPWIANRIPSNTAATWLAQQIELRSYGDNDTSGAGEILEIRMTGDDPKQLQLLVDAVTDAYLEKVAREERRQLLARQNLLDSTYTTKAQEVDRRRELIRTIIERVGVGDRNAQVKQQLLRDFAAQLGKELTETRMATVKTQLDLEEFRQAHGLKAGTEDESTPESKANTPLREDNQLKYNALVQEADRLKSREKALSDRFEEVNKTLADLGTSTEELERRKQNLAAVEETTRRLLQKLEQYDLELRSPERITLLQRATVRPIQHGDR